MSSVTDLAKMATVKKERKRVWQKPAAAGSGPWEDRPSEPDDSSKPKSVMPPRLVGPLVADRVALIPAANKGSSSKFTRSSKVTGRSSGSTPDSYVATSTRATKQLKGNILGIPRVLTEVQ